MNSAPDSSNRSDGERAAELVAEEGGAEEQAETRYEEGDTAAHSAERSTGDSGRETQPRSDDEVERSADEVERLERHTAPLASDEGGARST